MKTIAKATTRKPLLVTTAIIAVLMLVVTGMGSDRPARTVPGPKHSKQPSSKALAAGITTRHLDDIFTPDSLVGALIGSGPEAPIITNVSYQGAHIAAGTFSGGTGIIGFEKGIILSSGSIDSVVGPNTSDGITTVNDMSGDSDLESLIPGYETNDAAVLEFDFECSQIQVISFQYVFASDEYNEYVNSEYNDVFGFFLNGVNIALLPDKVTPVSINSINCGNPDNPEDTIGPSHCDLFRNNDLDNEGGSINTEMDGLTVVLTASAPLKPGVNHIKMAIADAGDFAWDSDVLIKGESFVCAEANQPPEFVNTCPDTILTEGDLYSCQITVSDPENDPITIGCSQKPAEATCTDHGDGTATFSFAPDYRHVDRDYTVLFEAFDPDTSIVDTLTISVINRPLIVDTSGGPPPQAQYLYIDDTIKIKLNEAVNESTLTDSCFSYGSVKGVSLTGQSDNSYPNYRLLVYPSSSDFLQALDTIACTLRTCILDSADYPLASQYVTTYFTGVVVFPGDNNNDGVVDERDILPLGLYWGNQGPARREQDLGLDWSMKPALPWVAGGEWFPLPAVYADADGSGTIDALDICGVTENWGQTHSGASSGTNGSLDIAITFKQVKGDALQQLYAALIDCPESDGKAALIKMLEPLVGSDLAEDLPTTYELYQNFPNPFNPSTTIKFYLPQGGRVTVSIYNIMGQKIAVLHDGYMEKGYGEVVWDGTDRSGKSVSSGIYFYRLETDEGSFTKRMLLLK